MWSYCFRNESNFTVREKWSARWNQLPHSTAEEEEAEEEERDGTRCPQNKTKKTLY
jgi:hypothetical protein